MNADLIRRMEAGEFTMAMGLLSGSTFACEVLDGGKQFAISIRLYLTFPDGYRHLIASLPMAMDWSKFGEEASVDVERDQQYRSLGKLLAAAPDLLACLTATQAELAVVKADNQQIEAFLNRFEGLILGINRALSGIDFHGETHDPLWDATWAATQFLYGKDNSLSLFLRERAARIAASAAPVEIKPE